MTDAEIGIALGRSSRWAAVAVASAHRREEAAVSGRTLDFDGSILALRKFTSSEPLDAGFNISMVAARQGHGPQVLAKHYAKSRPSADRRAAEPPSRRAAEPPSTLAKPSPRLATQRRRPDQARSCQPDPEHDVRARAGEQLNQSGLDQVLHSLVEPAQGVPTR